MTLGETLIERVGFFARGVAAERQGIAVPPLIIVRDPRKARLPHRGLLGIGDHGRIEARAEQELREVGNEMADRPDLALETVTLAQQHGEADAAAVVEHGKPNRDRTGISAGSVGERGPVGVRLELRRRRPPDRRTSEPVARSTSAIESLLEGLGADAPPRVEEGLPVAPFGKIGLDDGVDHLRHRFGAEARADDGADSGVVLRIAAERDLVELGAFLVDAEDADIAGVVMAAGIDAARHVESERADQLLALRVLEALGDLLGDRDRAGIGEIAIIEARAADHVAQEIVIAGGEPMRGEDVVERDTSEVATWGSIKFCV